MATISMISRSCPICRLQDDLRLFAEANVDLESLDRFAFASTKLPEYMHWRLVECRRCDLLYANPAPPLRSWRRSTVKPTSIAVARPATRAGPTAAG